MTKRKKGGNGVDTRALATKIILGMFQGAIGPEGRLALRNEAIGMYFKARAISWSKESIEYDDDGGDDTAAHQWFSGLLKAIRQAPGEFESEVAVATSYLDRRPSTATV